MIKRTISFIASFVLITTKFTFTHAQATSHTVSDISKTVTAVSIGGIMDQSPFIRLPPELRDDIYEMVLVQDHPIGISQPPDSKTSRVSFAALLQTCHQIRNEAIAIFYSSNSFVISTPGANFTRPCLKGWLGALEPETRLLIRRVFINEDNASIWRNWRQEMKRLMICKEFLTECGLGRCGVELFLKARNGGWMRWSDYAVATL